MEQVFPERLVAAAMRDLRAGTREGGAQGSPVVALVNAILGAGLSEGATDIHLEPQGGGMRIRLRVDGLLREIAPHLPRELAPVVIARLKVMAGIDTAKRNRPQDGKLSHSHEGRVVDMRVAVLPVMDGERMVVRIMDADARFLGCAELGFSARNLSLFES